jgi:hypothetical protein
LVNDDYNDRVIVISPKTNRIIWQYGHDRVPAAPPVTWTTLMVSTWHRRIHC